MDSNPPPSLETHQDEDPQQPPASPSITELKQRLAAKEAEVEELQRALAAKKAAPDPSNDGALLPPEPQEGMDFPSDDAAQQEV